MSAVPIGDVCRVTSGQSAPQDKSVFSDEGIPFIRAGSLDGLTKGASEDDFEHIQLETGRKLGLRLFPENTVIFAKSGMSAKIGRVYRLRKPCFLVSHLAAVTPGESVDASYLQRWFERNPPSRLIPNEAYPSIKTSEISGLKVQLPQKLEQQRIAAILDKADAIRRKRQQAIQLADEFLRSMFLEMFGDPVLNQKNWPLEPIQAVCTDIVDCVNRTASTVDYPTPYKMIRTTNVRNYRIDLSETKYVEKDTYDRWTRRLLPQRGDIVFTREAPAGEAGIITTDEHVFLGQRTMHYRPDLAQVTAEYLLFELMSAGVKRQIKKMHAGSTVTHLSVPECKKFLIRVPPVELQKRFSAIYDKNALIAKSHKELSKQGDALFGSLSQRAFHGGH